MPATRAVNFFMERAEDKRSGGPGKWYLREQKACGEIENRIREGVRWKGVARGARLCAPHQPQQVSRAGPRRLPAFSGSESESAVIFEQIRGVSVYVFVLGGTWGRRHGVMAPA